MSTLEIHGGRWMLMKNSDVVKSERISHEQVAELHAKTEKASKILYGISGAILILAVSIFFISLRNSESTDPAPRYNPLGEYPIQRVINDTLNANGEIVIDLHDTITIRGTKCVDGEDDVTVRGVVNWQPIDPIGTPIETGRGVATFPPGCTTRVYENVIPLEVREVMRTQWNNGIRNPVWYVTGEEYPINPETGEVGVSRVWVSENFIVDNRPDSQFNEDTP